MKPIICFLVFFGLFVLRIPILHSYADTQYTTHLTVEMQYASSQKAPSERTEISNDLKQAENRVFVSELPGGVKQKECSNENQPMLVYTTEPVDDDILINGTISYIKDLIVPPYDVKITFDKKTRYVYVKFRTPVPYKLKSDFSDFWDRWRFNQWIVLQEFKKAKIPVNEVAIETNHYDGSGLLKVTHLAEHIDKYAKLPDENLWLRTATVYQKDTDSNEWYKIE